MMTQAEARPASGVFRTAPSSSPPLELSGYDWAENLDFDGAGSLYVSDSERGEIWRVWLQDGAWTQALYFEGEQSINGLAIDGQELYATATTPSGEHQIIRLPLGQAGADAEVVATVPDALNGLEFDADGMLYATTEGNFLPGTGAVYRVYPDGGWDVFIADLWAADGIAIDRNQHLMYVTQVVNNKVLVVQMWDGTIIRTLSAARPSDHSLLDDIALDQEGTTLYGADFGRGEILMIPLDGSTPTVVYSGLDAPTSVLFGEGPTYDPAALYVTEGGGFTDRDQEQRVLEVRWAP